MPLRVRGLVDQPSVDVVNMACLEREKKLPRRTFGYPQAAQVLSVLLVQYMECNRLNVCHN